MGGEAPCRLRRLDGRSLGVMVQRRLFTSGCFSLLFRWLVVVRRARVNLHGEELVGGKEGVGGGGGGGWKGSELTG